ncbi:hypothetical protein GGI07_001789 [Coemansia sp. Benny D115]|nr:hypothetical protein GGI07_001789 [Coemansia sp. Benny D115]
MEQRTPTKQGQPGTHVSMSPRTPEGLAQPLRYSQPASCSRSPGFLSPFSSPALRRLDEATLRDRLREAYQMLKEKEKSLFLAATVGQELVDTNQHLQDECDRVRTELADVRQRLQAGQNDDTVLRLHGRRRSMVAGHAAQKAEETADEEALATSQRGLATLEEAERQWAKTHVQPVKAQLQMAQERIDELLSEREEMLAQICSLQQEHMSALRRASELTTSAEAAQKQVEGLEQEVEQLRHDLNSQRIFWTKRWSEAQEERKAGVLTESNNQAIAQRQAEDATARIRAEKRADDLQASYSTANKELELLRSQMERMEDERISEWEPMRGRWLSCEEALQELQETHQATCDLLAQAEARLAELDSNNTLNDPIKLKSDKTTTSLLGELDLERHNAVTQQRALAQEHMTLKRAYTRALNTQSRMKQQVARLTQLAANGANEARMKRLEAALGEAECQQQALLWASMEQRRSADADLTTAGVPIEADSTAIVTALRAKLKQVSAERDQSQRELRTAHLLRANEMQRTRDLERESSDAETRLRRAQSELAGIKAEYDSLKRLVKSGKTHHQTSPQEETETETRPLRKQDASGTGTGTGTVTATPTSSSQNKSGPMSLDFMINSEVNKKHSLDAEQERTVDGITQYRATVPNSAKKHRIIGGSPHVRSPRKVKTNMDPTTPDTETFSKEASLSSSHPRGDLNIGDAADRGLKSWLSTLGAVHASATVADSQSADSRNATHASPGLQADVVMASMSAGSRSNSSETVEGNTSLTHASTENTDNAADEIYIRSRLSQKPMECNNQ